MNIYIITQKENRGYDTYDSAIVCAKSPKEAKSMHPSGYTENWDDACNEWASSPSNVTAKKIGETNRKRSCIILSSFNAG